MLVLILVRKNEIQYYWEGPFEVMKSMNEVTYVKKTHGRVAVQIVHVSRLKAYHEREIGVSVICCVYVGTFTTP